MKPAPENAARSQRAGTFRPKKARASWGLGRVSRTTRWEAMSPRVLRVLCAGVMDFGKEHQEWPATT